jgi:hypothetical protein
MFDIKVHIIPYNSKDINDNRKIGRVSNNNVPTLVRRHVPVLLVPCRSVCPCRIGLDHRVAFVQVLDQHI